MKFYAVTAGSWGSFRHEAYFTTREAALEYISMQGPRPYQNIDGVNPDPVEITVYEAAAEAPVEDFNY